jgi:hypothetical protein
MNIGEANATTTLLRVLLDVGRDRDAAADDQERVVAAAALLARRADQALAAGSLEDAVQMRLPGRLQLLSRTADADSLVAVPQSTAAGEGELVVWSLTARGPGQLVAGVSVHPSRDQAIESLIRDVLHSYYEPGAEPEISPDKALAAAERMAIEVRLDEHTLR